MFLKIVCCREVRGSAPQSAPGSRASSVPPFIPMPPASTDPSPYIMASLNPALVDHPRQQTASPYRAELEEENHMVVDQVSQLIL